MANEEGSLRNKVMKGFLWLGTGTFVSQFASWLSTLIVIRMLSPSDYGLMAMAASFITFMAMVSELGFNAAIIQSKELEEREIRQIFGLVIAISLLGCILTYLISPYVALFYGEPKLVPLIRLLSVNFIISSLFIVPQSMLIREVNFRSKAHVDIISRLTACILTLVLAIHSMGVWALALGEVFSYIVRAIGFNLAYRHFHKPIFHYGGFERFFKYGISVTGDRILYFFFSQSDMVIAGRFLGKESLGIYAIALNLASIPMEKILPIVTQVSFTAYSRIQNELALVRKSLLAATNTIAFIGFPMFFGLAAIAPEGIPLILGSKWASVVIPFQLLCLILPLKALNVVLPPAVFAIGKPVTNLVNMAITCVFMIAAFLVGVKYDIFGLCIAWISIFPIIFVVCSIRSLKVLQIPFVDFIGTSGFPFFASILMLLALTVIRSAFVPTIEPIVLLVAIIGFGIFIYGGLALLFKYPELRTLKDQLYKR